MHPRQHLIEALRKGDCPDILIIGGGINGVGIYRDLAAQGVPALLVEAGDFASGTSSAPSRLIHGGLRYLETGEAALVRESLTERNLLLHNASHVVRPIAVWVPLRSWTGGTLMAALRFTGLVKNPGPKGALVVKLGLVLYDLFGKAYRTMPKHRMLMRAQALREVPPLSPDICAVGEYYDARISHPERLVTELVADAENDCPAAMAIPYLAAGTMENGRITLIVRETGEKISVAPKMVVNASGAWVDRVQGNLGFTDRMIGGTKGAHLIMRHAELAKQLGDTMLYFETDDHRSCLIYKMDSDLLMLGTTDLRNDNPDDKTTTEAEVDYLFGVLRPILPKVRFTRQDIVFAYAGVRPLPLSKDSATGAISRDHKLVRYPVAPGRPFPMVTLVGGKWTTYRVVGEQIAADVLQFLGKERRVDTKALPIGGGNGYPALGAARDEWLGVMAQRHQLSQDRCRLLATRYGAIADGFAAAEATRADRFAHLKDYTPAEIDLITRTERVTRLEDVVLRRTLMAFEGAVSVGSLDEVSKVMAAALGWDETSRLAEVEACARLLRERHRMVIA